MQIYENIKSAARKTFQHLFNIFFVSVFCFLYIKPVMIDKVDKIDKSDKKEKIPFRVIIVDAGFEVWAGKSSENNDLLSTEYCAPNDLWFHARGSGGSHVVLKENASLGDFTKKSIEHAAQIAAYYSKQRNASKVSVAFTLAKFVKKPSGVPSGTVYIQFENIVKVKPCLPENKNE